MKNFQWRSLTTRITLLTLAIFLASIWSLALYAISTLREDMRRLLGEQQFSTVTLAAAQVDSDLKDRLNALEKVSGTIDADLLDDPVALHKSLARRPAFQSLFNRGTVAARLDGSAVAGVPPVSASLADDDTDNDAIAAAIRVGKPAIGRPTDGTNLNSAVIRLAVPLRDAQGRVIGALAGVVDLGLPNFLEPLTQVGYGASGGYLLVAPQDRLILAATDKSRVVERSPDSAIKPTADPFTENFEGSVVYVNAVGVEILASAKRIPTAGWLVVAMLPASEAFAPVLAMQWRMLLTTIILTLLSGALIWWLLRHQLSPLISTAKALAAMPEANQAMQPLPLVRDDEIGQLIAGFNGLIGILAQREEALKKGEFFKNNILNSVNAEIVALARDGSIQAVNDRWRQFALENGREPGKPVPHSEIGANYLAVCDADSDLTPAGGRFARQGIQAVLDGRLPSFSVEYPCDSPQQQRWFSMIVMPLGAAAADGVAITHTEITAFKQAEQALAESDELLRLFIKYAPAGLAMFDRNMCYLYASSRWLADYGLGDRDVHGLSHYEVFPEISEEWKEAHRRALAGEVLRSAGERFERLDGSEQWVRWEIRPWYNAQRRIGGIVMFTEDITANKKAEAALLASEKRLSLVLHGTQDGFWDWDLAHGALYYSPRWWAMLGYAEGELGADPELWLRLTHPEDQERVKQVLAATLASDANAYDVEFRLRHKDGHYVDIVSRALVVRDAEGKAIRVAGANMDITQRKQMEEALREQEEFFRLLAENLEGFVAVLDTEGRRIYNSPSYARLLNGRELSGTSSFGDVHPADRERVIDAFRDAVATGIGQHLEYRFVMGDGSSCLLESRSGVIKDHEGRSKRVVVVSHDVTEQRQAEEKIHHLAFNDGLTQLPNRLTLSDRLRQTMAASKRTGCYAALMFLDLDNFKPVNDMHGHDAGDLLLIEAAGRLRSCMRQMDTVARFGGDEFVVLLSVLSADKAESTVQARRVAEKIRRILSEPYRLTVKREGEADTTIEHRCTASIGVALFLDHEVNENDLLRWADAAMYQAKEAGRNLIRFYATDETQRRLPA